MDRPDDTLQWLVEMLTLTNEEEAALSASTRDDHERLAVTCEAVRVLQQHARPELLGNICRRPLPALEGHSLLQVLIDEPNAVYRMLASAFDWSGIA